MPRRRRSAAAWSTRGSVPFLGYAVISCNRMILRIHRADPFNQGADFMAIDFTLAPEHEEIRSRVRAFVDDVIKPTIEPFGHRDEIGKDAYRSYVGELIKLRGKAVDA